MLLGNTEQSDVPDIQQQAGRTINLLYLRIITPAPVSDKENCTELATSLDPVNQEVVLTLVAQKSVDTSPAKVLNSVNRYPSELLVYPTYAKKKQRLRNM